MGVLGQDLLFARLFPKDYLMVVDESRNTFTSERYVWRWSKPKENFVEYGFRSPCNGQPSFEIWELSHAKSSNLCVGKYLQIMNYKTDGVVVEQVIRPTGLLDLLKFDQA
jgi:excinuclease UvrABC helicase subunit UvrB